MSLPFWIGRTSTQPTLIPSAAADGHMGSNVYEVNPWLWQTRATGQPVAVADPRPAADARHWQPARRLLGMKRMAWVPPSLKGYPRTSLAILSQLIPGYASLDILSLGYPNLRNLYLATKPIVTGISQNILTRDLPWGSFSQMFWLGLQVSSAAALTVTRTDSTDRIWHSGHAKVCWLWLPGPALSCRPALTVLGSCDILGYWLEWRGSPGESRVMRACLIQCLHWPRRRRHGPAGTHHDATLAVPAKPALGRYSVQMLPPVWHYWC